MTESTGFSKLEKRATVSLASLYGFRMLGLFMVLPVLALYQDNYADMTPFLLGLTLGVYGLTQAILQIPLGLLSDRIGRAPVIIGGLLVFVLGSVVAAMADTIQGLILGRALQGMGAIASTLMAMVTDLTSEENRTKAMASIGASIGLSFILAMIAGPVIASAMGLSGVFWVTAVLGCIGILVFVLMVPRVFSTQKNRETLADLNQIGVLLKQPTLLRLNLGVFALHLALMAAFVVIPTMLSSQLGISGDDLWWVYLTLLGGGFVAMLPVMILGEKYQRQKPAFVSAIACMTLAMLMLGREQGAMLTMLMLLLFFAAFNFLEATLPSWLSRACPAGSRGTAMGIYSTSQFMGAFVGGTMGGWSLHQFGGSAVFLLVALVLVIWWFLSLSLKSPRPLQTLVLQVGEMEHRDFVKIISNIVGVEDILVVEGESLAYAKVDKKIVDMTSIKPYLNRN
ncbi:MAG: MFS transporter [Porticoccaceae bacterium]|nr:MFS transporter [Porticoccaceae bacterium]